MKTLVVVYAAGQHMNIILDSAIAYDVITMYLRYVRKERHADTYCSLVDPDGKISTVLRFEHIASMMIKQED